jgi:hypothetical protein
MLSLTGWLNGLSATVVVVVGCLAGLFLIYTSIKKKAKLLMYLGASMIFAGFLLLGATLDFLTILLSGRNIDNTYRIVGLVSALGAAPATILGMYIGAELLMSEKKKYIVSIYIIIGIIYELFLFLDTQASFIFNYPEILGEELIDSQMPLTAPAGILVFFFIISLFVFYGLGFLRKGIQSTGIIRKKFFLLSIGYFLYLICIYLDTQEFPGFGLIAIRSGLILSFWLWYSGIKEKAVKPKKKPKIIESELEKGRMSLIETLDYHRPAEIAEEDIVSYREQNICLVCKGQVNKFNLFLCSKCDTLYCKNCALTLSDLENACWVCNTPFDETKPSKPSEKEKEKEKIILKESGKTKRTKNTKKKEK